MTLHRGWCRSWYNGWSPAERHKSVPIQLAAYKAGVIQRPAVCSMCGAVAVHRSSDIILHLERYDTPLEGYGCCRRCHAAIHARFARPDSWKRLLARLGVTRGWVTALSLDPGSQWRPFSETYDRGLTD